MPEAYSAADLVVVSEYIPLLDASAVLESFTALFRLGGAVAIYFYSRPLFTSGDPTADAACDTAYERVVTRISTRRNGMG